MASMRNYFWEPSDQAVSKSNINRYIEFVNQRSGENLSNYWDLYQWSISDLASFWDLLSQFVDIKWIDSPQSSLSKSPLHKMLGHIWFPEGKLNFAENLIEGMTEDSEIISVCEGQSEDLRLNKAGLVQQVAQCAEFLKECGVTKGDRVSAVLPNTTDAIIGMLATASLGAVWSSSSPDFGVQGIVDRFSQVEPKVLFATAAYRYNGKLVSCEDVVFETIRSLPSLQGVLITDPTNESEFAKGSFSIPVRNFTDLDEYDSESLFFEPVSFNDPLYIMFSSGTTGVPKCIVHGVGGTLIQHKKELSLHCDLGPGETLMYFTTCGWMMWNWMASTLSVGANLVLFEGSPAYPNISRLWDVASKYKVSAFGTSPKFLAATENNNFVPKENLDLSSLRMILSTGAPLLPEQYDWIKNSVDENVHVASISGGTDIISCFMLGVPVLPVNQGEIQAPGLGMAVECWVDGKSIIGEKGELVCTKPFPSMPLGFLNDKDDKKYREAYFEFYDSEQVWRHGDFISVGSEGGITVFGRSDATLNPGGVRIGTAEIYRVVETSPGVSDSIAIARQGDGDVEIVLFIKMSTKGELRPEQVKEIRSSIKDKLTPRHVPKYVCEVSDIPYTRSGKKLEIAVTRVVHGENVPNKSAIANPESLEEYIKISKFLG